MRVKIKLKLVSYLLSVAVLSGCILIAGCSHIFIGKDHNTYVVPQEKLKQIDVLELLEVKDTEAEEISGEEKDKKAPAEFKLSLEECRALTLENNLDLKTQLINPAIMAERVNEQEAANFEALFSVEAEYSKAESVPASYYDILYGTQRNTINIKPDVEKKLRSGGTITSNLTDNRAKSNALFSTYNPTFSSDLSFSINQPLLRNAGKRAATYYVQLYENNRKIVSAQTKQIVTNVIAMADLAYWNLYTARKLLDVRNQEYNLAKDLLNETERLVEVGFKAGIETFRAQAGVSSRYEQIIKAKNTVRDAERYLKRILNKPGLGIITDTTIILTTEPDPVRYEFDKEKMVTKAMENRMDVLEMELRLAMDDSAIEYSRNQLLPVLNIYYAYNMNGLGGSRHDSYNMLFDNDYVDHTAQIYASIPLGGKAAKSRLSRAILTRTKQLSSMENKKAMIENEVLKGIDQMETSWQHILASRKNAIAAGTQYKAEKRQYELGARTSNDVLTAQKDLTSAQVGEVIALAQYQVDLINLAYSTGTLLGEARVDLGTIK